MGNAKKESTSEFKIVAYVDGSFNSQTGTYGSAAVITDGANVLESIQSSGTKMASMRNIAGEIEAAKLAVEAAKELMADSLLIRYDYEGIEKWVTGAWNANKNETREYAEYMRAAGNAISITFEHVKAHSGDVFNEMADTLSGQAAGIVPLEQWVPEYNRQDDHLEDNKLASEYNVPMECILGIRKIQGKSKKAFSDFARLKIGRRDAFSELRGQEFAEVLDPSAFQYIVEIDIPGYWKDVAMRWAARGLNADEAVLKAMVDKELRQVA